MEELFEQLQDDTQSFWQSTSSGVRRLDEMPSPAEFFRDYVATSTPVIISSGGTEASSHACLKPGRGCSFTWGDVSSLARRSGLDDELEVTVDFTPDGRGDCVVEVTRSMMSTNSSGGVKPGGDSSNGDRRGESGFPRDGTGAAAVASGGEGMGARGRGDEGGEPIAGAATAVFVKPEERRMKFDAFLAMLSETAASSPDHGGSSTYPRGGSGDNAGGGDGVPYLSHQNDSLRQEFPGLMADVEPSLALARETFGNEPDAVNLWIGDDRSQSAVHKDHYENMYCVLRGEKHFTLLPPSDVLFLYEEEYPQGRYRRAKGGGAGFEVVMEEGTVPWIPVDPACPDLDKYPLFRHASPVRCRLGPGDILYLPALWYHRVSQRGITVAVNYWHDMQFDHKYVYYRFLQTLATVYQKKGFILPAGETGAQAEAFVETGAPQQPGVPVKKTGKDYDDAGISSDLR